MLSVATRSLLWVSKEELWPIFYRHILLIGASLSKRPHTNELAGKYCVRSAIV